MVNARDNSMFCTTAHAIFMGAGFCSTTHGNEFLHSNSCHVYGSWFCIAAHAMFMGVLVDFLHQVPPNTREVSHLSALD